jgi:hypothetical protein
LITGHVFGDGKVKFATCSDAFNCTGKFQLPRCTQPKPVITCISGKKPLNGVCLNPEPTPMNPYNNLTKNWSGPWNWSGPTATHTCTANNGGTMTMNLIQSGKSFSGSIEATGIQTLNSSTCQVKSTDTYTGTVDGTIDGQVVTFTFTLGGASLKFFGTGALVGGVFSGSLTRTTGGNGSFNLH